MSDPRDSNHDGRVSFLEKIKDKLHLGHKDHKDNESVTYHTSNQPITQNHADCPGCKALASQQSYQPNFVGGQIYQPLGFIPESYPNGVYSSGYDTTCQGCVAERLAAGASGVRGNICNSHDLNHGGYISAGEKLAGTTGSFHSSSFPHASSANVDLKRRHSLDKNRDLHHSFDGNHDRRHSLGDKFAGVASSHPSHATYDSRDLNYMASAPNGQVYDSRDRNGDGHVSIGEKLTGMTGSHAAGTSAFRDRNGDGRVSIGEKFSRPASSQTYDFRDRNGDGYVSTGEKLASGLGSRAVGYDSRDRNADGHVSLGEKLASTSSQAGTYAPRDRNGDDHVSLTEKLAVGSHDSRDRNHDGHVSIGEKLASGSHSSFQDETRLTLHEERLVVVKGEVSAGEVGIRKHVQEERVEQAVPVMREEFVVERRPLNGVPSEGVAGPDEISRVTLYREQIVRHRRLVPTEEVIVRKKIVTEHTTIGDTLRSERFETAQLPASNASISGVHDARDLNRDGHVSASEKLSAAAMGASHPTSDVRDLNGDGHLSTSEKLQAGMGRSGFQAATGNEARLRLHEEQLAVSKREVSAGQVDVIKRVQEEYVQQSVPLKREELVVERRPITGADFKSGATTPDEIMRFTLYREEIVVEKRRIPMEEVIVRKKLVTEHEIVSDTLRSEHIEVKQVDGSLDARDTNRDGHVSTRENLQAAVGGSKPASNASISGVHDARDLNRDGHVSASEKLSAAAMGASHPTSDVRDLNGDGHLSTSEKLQAGMGRSGFQAARG